MTFPMHNPSLADHFTDENNQPLFENSKYFDQESFQTVTKQKLPDNLSIFCSNARSLLKNKSQFDTLFESLFEKYCFKFEILSFVETWLNDDLEELAHFNGYQSAFKHKVNNKEGGGMALFVHESIDFKIRDAIFLSV
jgi:hypothetical protein